MGLRTKFREKKQKLLLTLKKAFHKIFFKSFCFFYKKYLLLDDNENVAFENLGKLQKIVGDEVRIPIVESIDETINEIILKKKSICRYGDGEFKIALNYADTGYQKKDELLSNRLKEILLSKNENILVGIWDFFGDLDIYTKYAKEIGRRYMKELRQPIYNIIDMDKTYWNAFITRFYLELKDQNKAKFYFDKIKRIWDNQEVVMIEGEYSKFGVHNDLFDNAKSIQRILCPSKNAFDKYTEILETAQQLPKDKLILIALGQTATVLAYDLALSGHWALDVGHLDIEYEWFKLGVKKPVIIQGKYTNDANEEHGGIDTEKNKEQDEVFLSQVIRRIC